MEIKPFRQLNNLPDITSGAKPPGMVAPRMYRQAMIKDRDNNIYAVYGDRLKKGGESTPILLPWDAIDLVGEGTVDSEGKYSSYKCKIYPGLVSGAYPGNMLQEFTGLSGTRFLVAEVTTDGWSLLSVVLSFSTLQAAPVPSQFVNAPSSFKITIGLFVSGVYFNFFKRNITATVKEAGRQAQQASGPFDLPYKSLWTWLIA
jgi:hypothetical protein